MSVKLMERTVRVRRDPSRPRTWRVFLDDGFIPFGLVVTDQAGWRFRSGQQWGYTSQCFPTPQDAFIALLKSAPVTPIDPQIFYQQRTTGRRYRIVAMDDDGVLLEDPITHALKPVPRGLFRTIFELGGSSIEFC